MKQIFTMGICALIFACGNSSENSTDMPVADSLNRSGSAYNTYDTVPSSAPAVSGVSTPTVAAAPPIVDTTGAGTATQTAASAATPAKTPATAAKAAAASDDSAEAKRGEALISKSDCLACHKVQDKLVGPAYKEVADKYPNNAATINQLAAKIKAGGSGAWGPIPMTPHPTLSDDDAKAMAKYVMSLK